MREKIAKALYKLFPFDLRGDCIVPPAKDGIKISCVINFYDRFDLPEGILFSLVEQKFPRGQLVVMLVEDNGGTEAGKSSVKGLVYKEMASPQMSSLRTDRSWVPRCSGR